MQKTKAAIAALVFACANCGGDSAGPDNDGNGGGGSAPNRLEMAMTRAGAALNSGAQVTVGDTVHLAVTAFTATGAAIPGVAIEWSPTTGTLITSEATTSAAGARATWVVGTVPGNQMIAVSVRNASVQTSAALNAVTGPVFRLALQPGYGIFVTGRRQIPITAVDRFGNPAGTGTADSWISLDPSIAAISSNGALTGVAPGSARIIAVQGARSDTLLVPVLDPHSINQGLISAGNAHSCRLDRDGRAYCWGYGRWGELGGGAMTCNIANSPSCGRATPEPVAGNHRFSYIDGGSDRSFAITTSGVMMTWGTWDGATPRESATDCSGMLDRWCHVQPVLYNNGPFEVVDYGLGNLCASNSGGVHCWYHPNGATGSGIQGAADYVAGNHTFTDFALNNRTTCALDVNGAAYCWGHATDASSDAPRDTCAGSPSVPCYLRPVPVATAVRFTAIAAGEGGGFFGAHTCALGADRHAYCWGRNTEGQLGAGSTEDNGRIAPVAGSLEFAIIGAGGTHTCGTTYAGDVYCWGNNDEGQLGNGVVGGERSTPVRVSTNVTFVEFAGGSDHTCGRAVDGKTYCWGDNEFGQIGIGTRGGNVTVPTPVVGQ